MSKILRRWDLIPGAFATLDGLHVYADRLACNEQDKRGECRAQWILVREADALIVATPFSTEEEKIMQFEWVRQTFAIDHSIQRAAFMSEIWVMHGHKDQPGVWTKPVDALQINSQQRDGRYLTTIYGVAAGSGRRKTRTLLDHYSEADVTSETGRLSNLFDAERSPGPSGP